MLRIVRTPEGGILPDPEGKREGRGAYLCRETACLLKAQKRKSLDRTLKAAVPGHVFEELRGVTDSHGTGQDGGSDRAGHEGGQDRRR